MARSLIALLLLASGVFSCCNCETKKEKEGVNKTINPTDQLIVNETNTKYVYAKLVVKDMFKWGDTAILCSDVIEISYLTADTLKQIVDGYEAKIQMYAHPGSVTVIDRDWHLFDTYEAASDHIRKNYIKD